MSLDSRLLALLARPKAPPLGKVEISRKLGLSPDERDAVRGALERLEEVGEIVSVKKDRWTVPEHAGVFRGKIRFFANGDALVTNPGRPGQMDVFVGQGRSGSALPGDVVLALARGGGSGDRLNGEVLRVVVAANETVVGTLREEKPGRWIVLPDDPRFPQTVNIRPDPQGAPLAAGLKVVARLFPWKGPHAPLEGTVIETLGAADAPGVDLTAIIRRHRLREEFPEKAVSAAEEVPFQIPATETERRSDWRGRPVFTIDPDDARDFDDAIEVESLGPNRGWRLHVHIADVAHYVRPGSPLDEEARRRGNSTYLPGRVLPMLPERLSNGVCSLQPDVERLVFTASMEFAPDGRETSASFSRGVIRSARRFSYGEALAHLEAPRSRDEWTRRLHETWELASVLRARRFARGSLDLEMPEIKVRLDASGRPLALENVAHDRSHQLIEEFMLAANDAVALALKQRNIPALYRIHENPDPERLAELRGTLREHGVRAGDLTHRAELMRVLESLHGLHEEAALKYHVLRSLRRAGYSPAPLGHYGLAKANYAHFTSPIRRYADLVVHRALAQMLRLAPPREAPAAGDLVALGVHLSATERASADAERDAIKLKKIEFFRIALERGDRFRALVLEVRPNVLVVELPGAAFGGRVKVADLGDEYFHYDPAQGILRGRKSRRVFQPGMEMEVQVAAVDAARQYVDFRSAAETPEATPLRRKEEKKARRDEAPSGGIPTGRGGRGQPQNPPKKQRKASRG